MLTYKTTPTKKFVRTCSKSLRPRQKSLILEDRSAVYIEVNEQRTAENQRFMAGIRSFEQVLRYIIAIFALWCSLIHIVIADSWRNLENGISYRDLRTSLLAPWSHIHVFKIDLKKNHFRLLQAHDFGQANAPILRFTKHSAALITINAGFFDNYYRPLGLRIDNKKQYSPLKRVSWWGVFYIKNNSPFISGLEQYQPDPQIDFAIQSGPRLIINGEIPKLRPGRDERTALGITSQGKVIILVTENAAMTTTTLAELMRSNDLKCITAINLDGGSSSQLYANFNDLQIHVPGFAHLSDVIAVVKS